MRTINFSEKAFNEYYTWTLRDKNLFKKINDLITEIVRTPFKGTGKPEPLKRNLKGFWSRRITLEHRLIYSVSNDAIYIVSYEGHYNL